MQPIDTQISIKEKPKKKKPVIGFNTPLGKKAWAEKKKGVKLVEVPHYRALLGVRRKEEDEFKKKELIKFLATIKDGFIIEYVYSLGFYSTKKGIPDVFFWHHQQTYAFETKSALGKAKDHQILRHEEMRKAGIFVFVTYRTDFEELKAEILRRCT